MTISTRPTAVGALAFLCTLSLARGDDGAAKPAPVSEQLPKLHLLTGPWAGGTVHGESVLFVKSGDKAPSASLLFDADRVLTVQSADGTRVFRPGTDYQVAADGSGLTLTEGSGIPFLNMTDFFRPKGSPSSIPQRTGHPDQSVLFDNGHFFHDKQVEVTYVPRNPKWTGARPAFAGARLPRTVDKLRKKEPLTVAVSGDSISEGYNASQFTKVAPFMPPFPNLVTAQLEATYGAKVTLRNLAVGGWNSAQGVKDLDRLVGTKPDLVVIAYGMNDVGARNPAAFKANIETMLRRIKQDLPAAEVVLVSGMTGNPDWVHTPAEMFPVYRDALASLEGPGVVLADLTDVWLTVLQRKTLADLTGNGVNHPNDHGHRLYAQAILALLVDPALVPRADGPKD